MASQTFDEWLQKNAYSRSAANPMYVVSPGGSPTTVAGSNAITGGYGSLGIQQAMDQWKQEQSGGALSDLLSGLESGGGGGNPFGIPTMNTGNRFEAGLGDAETRLKSLLDNPDSINQSAAYKFRVGQGQEALQRSMGAKGMLNSGNRLMELTKYGQDMGSQEYENQFGRLGNLLTNYSGSWIGDKNANTSRYSAEAGAWNSANNSQNQLKAIALKHMLDQQTQGTTRIGSGGGMKAVQQSPFASNLGNTSDWIYNTGSYNPYTGQETWTDRSSGDQQVRVAPGTAAYNDYSSSKNTRQTY